MHILDLIRRSGTSSLCATKPAWRCRRIRTWGHRPSVAWSREQCCYLQVTVGVEDPVRTEGREKEDGFST